MKTQAEIEKENRIKELVSKVTGILESCGIRMTVGGCGCCGSPWVSFEKDGEMIVSEQNDFDFDMFQEKK